MVAVVFKQLGNQSVLPLEKGEARGKDAPLVFTGRSSLSRVFAKCFPSTLYDYTY